MNKVKVVVGKDGEMSIHSKGHTQSVVCASVSTLLQSTVRYMQELSMQFPEHLQVEIEYEE